MRCMFRIPEEGGRVLWELTNQCNYECRYCIFSAGHTQAESELLLADIVRVMEELRKQNYCHLKLSGGEPFMRKDIMAILKKAKDLGFTTDISTNASLITEEIASKLSSTSLAMIHVSLDGHCATIHEKVRGKNTYAPTIRGIQRLVQTGIYVRMGTVIYLDNQDTLEEMVQKAIELGVDEIIFSIMEPVGRMLGDCSLVTTRSPGSLEEEIKELRGKYPQIQVCYNWDDTKVGSVKICPAGERFLYIDYLGRIAPCTWLVTHDRKFLTKRSLREYSLTEVLEDPAIEQFRCLKKRREGICLGEY